MQSPISPSCSALPPLLFGGLQRLCMSRCWCVRTHKTHTRTHWGWDVYGDVLPLKPKAKAKAKALGGSTCLTPRARQFRVECQGSLIPPFHVKLETHPQNIIQTHTQLTRLGGTCLAPSSTSNFFFVPGRDLQPTQATSSTYTYTKQQQEQDLLLWTAQDPWKTPRQQPKHNTKQKQAQP